LTNIIDNQATHRFEVTREGHLAELTYQTDDGHILLIHTEVPEALGGHGLGGELVKAAVAKAAREGLTIIPMCPYARAWLQKHPDVAGSVTIDWLARGLPG
jgi:predicted GNAT family acetyltransferase